MLVTLSKPTTFDAAAPAMEKPERQSKAAFDEFQFVDGPYIADHTGTLTAIQNNLLPLVIKFDRPNTNFLQAFQISWVNMKLGTLTVNWAVSPTIKKIENARIYIHTYIVILKLFTIMKYSQQLILDIKCQFLLLQFFQLEKNQFNPVQLQIRGIKYLSKQTVFMSGYMPIQKEKKDRSADK